MNGTYYETGTIDRQVEVFTGALLDGAFIDHAVSRPQGQVCRAQYQHAAGLAERQIRLWSQVLLAIENRRDHENATRY